MTLDEETQLKQRCEKALDEIGASPALRKFCLEVIVYEQETSGATLRMHEKLRQPNDDIIEHLQALRLLIESMTEDFARWNRSVDGLVSDGKSLPPLQAPRLQGRKLQAPKSLQTRQLQIEEGDIFTITDTSKPNLIQVCTEDGKQDYVPILGYILQGSDETVTHLLQRLLVQLLSSWTDCISQSGKNLVRSAINTLQSLNVSQSELAEVEMNGSSIVSRLKEFCEIAKRVQTELVAKKTGKIKTQNQEIINNLLKTFAAYQLFFEHWNNFRLQLKGREPKPICIFEKLEDFRNHASENGQLKCFTTTFVIEQTEICEETIYIPLGEFDDDASSSYGGGGYWKQLIETEQLTSTSQEEKKRYIIKAVKDPRSGQNISLKEAVQDGIMDMKHGIYTNPDTQESTPIGVALSDGNIQVDYVTKTRSAPRTEALGLITVRDRIESRKYTIVAVVDATTAEKVDLSEAKRRGLVDDGVTYFVMTTSGERVEMQDAVDSGWVLVEYEADETTAVEPEFQTRTYAVRAVVDQRLKRRVPFLEAVQKKLIDRESGNYYNNATGETIYALEAIRRGFLKAKLIDDPSKLDIDPTNKMVVESINKMKCLVTGLSALSAMKESANRLSSSSNGIS